MFERSLILKHLPTKDSFLYINSNLKSLKTGTCVRVTTSENCDLYFSIGDISVDLEDNYIGLSSLFAKALNIYNNTSVRVSEVPTLPSVSSFTVLPVNHNEYEVLEMFSDNVQDTLLSQIRVIYKGQKIVIWVGSNINVTVCVGSISPVSPGVIDFLTEVHVEKSFSKSDDNALSTEQYKQYSNYTNWFSKFVTTADSQNKVGKYLKQHSELIYRIVTLKKLPIDKIFLDLIHPFTVYLSKSVILENQLLSSNKIFQLSLLTNDDCPKDVYVKLMFLEDVGIVNLNLGKNLYVGQELVDLFDIQIGSRVILKHVDKCPIINEIQINVNKIYSADIIETFKSFLARGSDTVFVLNSDIPFDFGNIICSLKFFPDEPKFCVIDDNLVRNCKYLLNIDYVVKLNRKIEDTYTPFIENILNIPKLVHDVVGIFSMMGEDIENVLITGKSGTGKSTILSIIARALNNYPHFIFTKHLKCKGLKGKTMDSLLKFFYSTFSELILHQPAVLILDDLHVLCESTQGDEIAPNNIYFNRVSEMLHQFLKSLSTTNNIGILATSGNLEKLNKNIYSSRGSHLFKNVFSIADLKKVDRIATLKFLFADYVLDNDIWNDLGIKTEGFVIQDLKDFSNKTLFEILKHESEDIKTVPIKREYLETALKNTSVISLENVHLHSPGDKDFSSIGGLTNAKTTLMKSLLWPGRYPNIFANAPLRLQSGLLLYGPPGTGKTVIAAAAAKQCGMRLISVKGPELLSKYIGASEQAVRDTFQKAQSAKPCILFFDEFDSLAPRRGHDSTGVTDRVVNQLLTQLDGIESLTGVSVLAATSRPDLLDSALLRPGRLDKQLLCPLPNQEERLDILQVLSKNLHFSDDICLHDISVRTEHFSGADLQSLLYSAHMLTIDYSFDNEKLINQDNRINQTHLEEALRKTKPSLSNQERLKYERIYAKFETGSTLNDPKMGTRATLA